MRYNASSRSLFLPERDDTPEPGPQGWSRDALCAELARLAYYRYESGDKARLDAALARLGFGAATSFTDRRSGTQAFVTLDAAGTAYVAWRGTHISSVIDALVDAMAWRVKWRGEERVHAGFAWAYRRLAGTIDAWLAEANPVALVTTGHSLGAALATLFAREHAGAELVTIGSPRVGNAAFAAQFAGRPVRRYIDCIDTVATVPWEWMGYVHTGAETYIDSAGTIAATPSDPASRRADAKQASRSSWQIYRLRDGNLPFRSMTDHAPINYVSALLGIRES